MHPLLRNKFIANIKLASQHEKLQRHEFEITKVYLTYIRTGTMDESENYTTNPRANRPGYLALQKLFHQDLPASLGYVDIDDWEREHYPHDEMLCYVSVKYHYNQRIYDPETGNNNFYPAMIPGHAIFQTVLSEERDIEWKLLSM